jgi:hypothetical protein
LYNHFHNSLSLKSNNNRNVDPIETRLEAIGLKLPKPLKIASNIQTPFAWVRVRGNKAYISGHGPQNPDGSVAGPFGKVGAEVSLEQGYEAAKLAGLVSLLLTYLNKWKTNGYLSIIMVHLYQIYIPPNISS